MRPFPRFFAFVSLFLFPPLLLAPPRAVRAQTLEWAARYNGPNNGPESSAGLKGIAVDGRGGVFVTGGSSSDTSGGGGDIVTVKYNASGAQEWAARYNGPGGSEDRGDAVAVDAQGNVYVTGYASLGQGIGYGMVTLKYNNAGNRLWAQTYRDNARDGDGATGIALAVGKDGSCYVTGYANDAKGGDYLTVKYSSNGTRRWVARQSGPGNNSDAARAVALDASGDVFVTGSSENNARGINYNDYLTVKYKGATGETVWSARYTGPGTNADFPADLVVDAQGDCYVAGVSGNGANNDYATLKYNGATGAVLWTRRYNNEAANGDDSANALAVDGRGGCYVTGQSFNKASASGGTDADYLTIKYDSASGATVWTQRYDGGFPNNASRSDSARAVVADLAGNVLVTGVSSGGATAEFGTGNDIATVKYNGATGDLQFAARFNSGIASSNDSAHGMAGDSQGNVYVCGGTPNANGALPDLLTLKYSVRSPWRAQDIATGSDNKTRLLWNRDDGAIALWVVSPTGTVEASKIYGPYAGLRGRALAMGAENKPRVLWEGATGKAVVWTVKPDLSAVENGYTFNAAGYTPWEIAVGASDNKTRLSWYDARNHVAIWTLTGGAVSNSVLFNAPVGYQDQAIAVGSADNRIRLVWNDFGSGKAALWTLNATTLSTIDAGYLYGPISPSGVGWYIADVAAGSDNKPRLLWVNNDNQAALWRISATTSAIEKSYQFGPLPMGDWVPTHQSHSNGDGNTRLLWTAPTGAAQLWTVDAITGAVVRTTAFGPL